MSNVETQMQELFAAELRMVFGRSCVAYKEYGCVGVEKIDLGIFDNLDNCSKAAQYTSFGGWLIGKPAKSFEFNGKCIDFNFQTQTYLQTQ